MKNWIKLKNYEKINLEQLVFFIAAQENPNIFRVTWNVTPEIIGCYPLAMMETVPEDQYTPNTIFTIWERKFNYA